MAQEPIDYMQMHDVAIAEYERAAPPVMTFSATALRRAVDAAFAWNTRAKADDPAPSQEPIVWVNGPAYNPTYPTVRIGGPASGVNAPSPPDIAGLVERATAVADWLDFPIAHPVREALSALTRIAQERDEARETNRKLNRLNQKYEHAFKYGLQTLEEKAIGGQRFPTDAKMFLQAWHMYRDARDRAEAAAARLASARDEALEGMLDAVDSALNSDLISYDASVFFEAAIRALKEGTKP